MIIILKHTFSKWPPRDILDVFEEETSKIVNYVPFYVFYWMSSFASSLTHFKFKTVHESLYLISFKEEPEKKCF